MALPARLLRPMASANVVPRFNGIGAWFDATDSSTYTLDTGVSEWRCKAISGQKFTQSVGASQPTINATGINGKPVLSFDGSNDWMTLGAANIGGNNLMAEAGNAFSAFVVAKTNGATGTFLAQAVGNTADRTFHMLRGGNPGSVAILRGGTLNTNSTTDNSLYAVLWNGSAATWRQNNSVQTITVGAANLNEDQVSIGARTVAVTPAFFLNGYIGEILFFNRALVGSEQSALFSYLNAKWGLSLT